MSAVPKQVISMPKVKGLKTISAKTYTTFPINSSGTTTFRYDGNNQIVFSIPAFKGSWLNPQKTFLRFQMTTDTGCFPAQGCPVFGRLQLRIGNVVAEDIMGYAEVERALSNFDSVCSKYAKANYSGDYRITPNVGGQYNSSAELISIYNNGTTIEKSLVSGVLGKEFQEHFIPLSHFSQSGGSAMELTLWLEDPAIATLRADAGAVGYTLSDVQLQLEVVEMPQSLNEKLDKELFNGGAFKLPYSTWRQHINHIPSGSQNAELSINESAHNIENVMTVMTKQSRPAIVNYDNTTLATSRDNLDFLGGHGDRTKLETDATYTTLGAVKSYQFSYDTDLYPQKRAEMGTRDNKLALLNAVHTLDKWNADCFAGGFYTDGRSLWDEAGLFALVQSFKTSRDDYLNGLNSSASGSPLMLSLTLKKALTAAVQLQSFVKSTYQLNIKKGGNVDIINGSAKENLD